jgi:sterol desaturase/sphingolipid hydroxylase (fatty acid hydroxylase superfamily)
MELFTASWDDFNLLKRALPAVVLAVLWGWESWCPFFGQRTGRLRHAGHNLAIAIFNTVVIALVFGSLTAFLAYWAEERQLGLLYQLGLSNPFRFSLALILLDGWMYVWHRANHLVPLLWRFHRMHHSDPNMDVTTATRFHFGEQVLSSILRLALIPLLGFQVWMLVVYDTVALSVIMFHHADISLSKWDRWLRCLIVTPDMHKVHHSNWQPETDSNFSTVLSIWDRMARSFRMRPDLQAIVFGLEEFNDSSWQTWFGLWKTPFITVKRIPRRITSANQHPLAPPSDPQQSVSLPP